MKVLQKVSNAIREYLRTTDRWLLFFCVLLSGCSVLFIYGIVMIEAATIQQLQTQIIASLLGLAVAVVISLMDYRTLAGLWKIYLPLALIGVLLTYTAAFSVSRGSNQAWLGFRIGGHSFSLQPAEFLKIAFVMTFSVHLNAVKDQLDQLSTVLLLGAHGAGYVLLIVLQRDAGTALVYVGMFAIMIFLAQIDWKYILAGAGAAVLMAPLLWFKIMSEDQKMRFLVLRDPSVSDRYAYQQRQGLKALGLGGLRGTGFGGRHVHLPESYNDFIFAFIGQTLGLMGVLAIMALLMALILRMIQTANRSRDMTGRMICNGVMAMVLVQTVMNIGMCINVLPVIGVTLPLVSAGGSSVLATYIGIGLVLSVYRHNSNHLFH